MKVFICYVSQDKPLVRELVRLIRERSSLIFPWVSENEIRAAEDLREVIRAAIESSALVVVVLSEHTLLSEWINFELQTARKNKIMVVGIVAGVDHHDLPKEIQERRYLNLHDNSIKQSEFVVNEICQLVSELMLENDQVLIALQNWSHTLQATAINESQEAATVNIALSRLLPKLFRAIYYNIYAGVDFDEYPPKWLVECLNATIYTNGGELEPICPFSGSDGRDTRWL